MKGLYDAFALWQASDARSVILLSRISLLSSIPTPRARRPSQRRTKAHRQIED
jgi:hypothetical protein